MMTEISVAAALSACAGVLCLAWAVSRRPVKLGKPLVGKYDKAAFERDAADLRVSVDEILEKCAGEVPKEDVARQESIRRNIEAIRKMPPPVATARDVTQWIDGTPLGPVRRSPWLVLRPVRHPLYDTLIIRENGLMHGMTDTVSLFNDCRFFPDHAPKELQDTNMTQNGQLGTPLEYDMVAIDMHVVDYAKAEDVRKVLSALTCRWIFGSCTVWLTIPAGGFEPYLCNGAGGDMLDLPKHLRDNAEEMRKQAGAFMGAGAVWPFYRQIFTTPDCLARRIVSTESFRLDVVGKSAPLSAPVVLKFLTRGVLYQQL